MAHFAELADENIVIRVLVVSNDVLRDANGIEQESRGAEFLRQLCGGRWVQTSYNGRFRGRYAGPGWKYDEQLDRFIPPQPYPSWTLGDDFEWHAPIPMPEGGGLMQWDEPSQAWV